MSETLVQALVTGGIGLLGALVGAVSAVSLERRRETRRGEALRQAVFLDLEQWRDRLEAASEWRVTRPPGSGLKWWDVAGELALHTPIGLYLATAMLYVEREGLERPYSELYGPGPGIPQGQAASAQFGFRRAYMMVEEVLRLWVRYYGVSGLARAVRRVRRSHLEKPSASVTKDILATVSYRLRKELGYAVTDAAELIADVERSEQYKEELDRGLSESQGTQGDIDPEPQDDTRDE